MNISNSIVTTLFVGCCLSSTVAHAQDDGVYRRGRPDSFDVIISEVCYLTEEGQSEWGELTNVADTDVDIAGWELTDGGALNFIISASSLVMPPKSYLVVRLDGSGKVPDVTDKMRVTTYSPAGVKGNLLGDKGGQLALYSATANAFSPGKIRGYVAWGRTPGQIVQDAFQAGRWYGGSIVGTGPGVMGPVFTMRPGGSIGLVGQMEDMKQYGFTDRDWGIFSPLDTNAGETGIGRRRPGFTFYEFGTDDQGNGQITAIIMQEEGVNYQFQLSTELDFKTIASDFTSPSHGYTIDKPFAPGETRYARVRAIYPNGNISAWSETKTLTRRPY